LPEAFGFDFAATFTGFLAAGFPCAFFAAAFAGVACLMATCFAGVVGV
jgi:hypothetical protein